MAAPSPRPIERGPGLTQEKAVAIVSVNPSSPADRAGLETGDLILGLSDVPVTGVDDLHRLLTHEWIGQRLALKILRRGAVRHLWVVPQDPAALAA